MKFQKIITLLFLSYSVQSLGAIISVGTAFWQSKVENTQVLKIQPTKSINETCDELYSTTYSESGKLLIDKEGMEVLRRLNDNMSQVFTAQFNINNISSQNLIQKNILASNELIKLETNPLPMYFQQLTEINPLVGQPTTEIVVQADDGSLTAASISLGLNVLPIRVIGHGLQTQITVTGKDVACDILSGRARLKFTAPAIARISLEKQIEVSNIYDSVKSVYMKAAQIKKSVTGKAAIFGFSLVDVLEKLQINNETQLKMIGNITEKFFTEKMEPNSNWTQGFGNKLILDVNGAVQFSQNYTLESF